MKGLIRSTTPPITSITIHYNEKKDAVKHCFTVMFFDQRIFTTLTSDYGVVADWIAAVGSLPRRIGFEIELDLNTNRIGTIQLYSENRCLIFQFVHFMPSPPFLDKFLGNDDVTFLGFDTVAKINELRIEFPFPSRVRTLDMYDTLPFLLDVKQNLMHSLPLGKVETDWDRFPYKPSVNQVHYACLDAFLNMFIWKPLRSFQPYDPTRETAIVPYPEVVGANKKCYDVVMLGETIFTTVTKHPDAVKEWIDAVKTVHLSFEIEYTNTTGSWLYVGTVQLCDGIRCLVLQLDKLKEGTRLPPSLDKLLGNFNYSFFGDRKIKFKLDLLRSQFPFSFYVNSMMFENKEENVGFKYGKLNSIGLEEEDWTRPYELSQQQVHYACADAFLNYYIARREGKFPLIDSSKLLL